MNLSNQEKMAIIFLLVIIVAGLGILMYKNHYAKDELTLIQANHDFSKTIETKTNEKKPFIIHVAGAVKHPGVYQLEESKRVIDAIKIAGGATGEANLDAINLAAFIHDSQKIIVPFIIKSDGKENENKNKILLADTSLSSTNSTINPHKININIASESDLQCLPGIGPVLSERIVIYRNKNGIFAKIDEIKDVSGIGDKKFEGIQDLICVQ